MTGRPVRISIIANGRSARAELNRTSSSVASLNRTISRGAKVIGGAFAVGAIVRAGKAILANGDAYTSQLNKIEALTTAQQRAQVGGISGVAKQLEKAKGAYARYGNTVADAAGGVTELVKAGQTLPEALRSVNATLVLAKAGELGVADASSLVATALKDFHLSGKRAGDIANYLANAANISTSDVSDLGEALKFVGPVAHDVGISAQQTAAYLAQLSNAGIKGTMAGEGLRRVMLSLQSPTGKADKAIKRLGLNVFDAEGKARPFSDVLTDLSGKLAGLTDKQRKADLRAIFGLQGVTGAQVLLDNVKSLDAYTKGVERAGAAQKLAEANSKGLMGTLRRAKALFESSGQAAYRAFSPLVNKALKPMVDALERNQGQLEDQAKAIANRALPTMKSFGHVLQDTAQTAKDVAGDFKPFVPILGDLADVAKAAADGFHNLPGPLKSIATEVGIASLVMPRLAGGVGSVTSRFAAGRAALVQYRSDLVLTREAAALYGPVSQQVAAAQARMASRSAALLSGIRNVAGVGGLLALTKSASESDSALSGLESTLGAAAVGFSVGGPIGAAVGGAAGLVFNLAKAFRNAGDDAQEAARQASASKSWETAKASVNNLTEALYGTIRAYNSVTAAAVQQGFRDDAGHLKPWVQQLLDAGVSMDTLTRATLGQADAQKLLTSAQGKVGANLLFRKGAIDQAAASLKSYQDQLRALDQTIASQGHGATSGQLAEQERLNGLIRGSRTDLAAAKNAYKDYASTVGEGKRELQLYNSTLTGHRAKMTDLARQLGITRKEYAGFPKAVRTEFEAHNLPQTKTQLADLARQYKLTPKQVLTVLKAMGVTVSKAEAKSLGVAYNKVPKQITATAKVVGGQAAVGAAHSFGSQAGSAYGSGFVGGIAAWQGRAEFAAAAMAAAAHAAAMRNLDAHSPSRKMIEVGKWFSQGFAIGIRKDATKAIDATETMLDRIDKAQERILAKAPKSRRRALEKEFKEQDRTVRKLVKQYSAGDQGLKAIAARQSKVSDAIDNANQKLADARQAWRDYRDALKAGVVAFGDITALGTNGAGNVNGDALVQQLTTRRDAIQKYVADVELLKSKGLNGTALQQILDKGVDGGLQTAEALLAGGSSLIGTVNTLQAQIDQAGGRLGTSMANNFKLAGIQAAQGLVDGLLGQQKDLERIATIIANSLVKSVKKALKIKSPSRVFKQIGRYNIQGLRIGMDSTYVARTGELAAASLVKGFGTPALNAFMASPSLLAAQQQAAPITINVHAPVGADGVRVAREIEGYLGQGRTVGVRGLS